MGITLRNPAIALLGGLIIRLGLRVDPIKGGSRLGSISLQTAVVLLGFTLGFDRMMTVSADYGVVVGAYVLMTLGLGWILAKLFRGDRTEAVLLTGGRPFKALLVVALGLIGLELDRQSLRELSPASIALGVCLWLIVAPGALLLVLLV